MSSNQHVKLEEVEMKDRSNQQSNKIEIENKYNNKIVDDNFKRDSNVINNNSNDKSQEADDQHDKFIVPSNLKRTFICSMCLFIVGISLIIIGFISQVKAADPGNGLTFWILGSVVLIPGAYYSYQFYLARKNINNRREDILSNIPEL